MGCFFNKNKNYLIKVVAVNVIHINVSKNHLFPFILLFSTKQHKSIQYYIKPQTNQIYFQSIICTDGGKSGL